MLSAFQTAPTLALPFLSGLFFATVGIAYRLGQGRGLGTLHIVFHMGLWGAVFYALTSSASQWPSAPLIIIALGVVSGLTQWATLTLAGVALRHGPLSPMWCAMNLSFLPVTIYSTLVFGEPLHTLTILALLLAIASVLLASMLGAGTTVRPTERPRSHFLYGLTLVAMLTLNSILLISIKYLETVMGDDGVSLMSAHGPVYFTIMYFALGMPIGVQHLLRRDSRVVSKAGWGFGAMAAAGSIGGVGFLGLCGDLHGAVAFTMSAIVALLGAGLTSVLLFGEKANLIWFAMMGTAAGSVILVSL